MKLACILAFPTLFLASFFTPAYGIDNLCHGITGAGPSEYEIKSDPSISQVDRLALVIGATNYADPIGKLTNAGNDAQKIADNLYSLGFGVLCLIDPTGDEMIDALIDTSSRASLNSTILFYYAGHGAQVGGTDFLIPVNMHGELLAEDIEQRSIRVDYVLSVLSRHDHMRTIVIIDACRNELRLSAGQGRTLPAPIKGFGGINIDTGKKNNLWLVYTTSIGGLANDGNADTKAGLYVNFFAKEMMAHDKTLHEVIDETSIEVAEASGKDPFPYSQMPWQEGLRTLGGFSLYEPRSPDGQLEVAFNLISKLTESTQNCEYWNEFLESHRSDKVLSDEARAIFEQAKLRYQSCLEHHSVARADLNFLEPNPIDLGGVPEIHAELTARLRLNSLTEQMISGHTSSNSEAVADGVPIQADGVRIRARPTLDSPVLGMLYAGKAVRAGCATIANCESGWFSVQTPNGVGYIDSSLATAAGFKEGRHIDVSAPLRQLPPEAVEELRKISVLATERNVRLHVLAVNPHVDSDDDSQRYVALVLGVRAVSELSELGVPPSKIEMEYAAPKIIGVAPVPYLQIDLTLFEPNAFP